MLPHQLSEFLDRFTCVRVPTGSFERCFLYYRRYPKDFALFKPFEVDSNFSLYQTGPKKDGGEGYLQADKGVKYGKKLAKSSSTGAIDVKSYGNPYAVKPKEEKNILFS